MAYFIFGIIPNICTSQLGNSIVILAIVFYILPELVAYNKLQ